MIKKIFVDSDVILDVLQERNPFVEDAVKIFNFIDNGKVQGFISPLIFSNLYYILRKYKNAKFALSSLLRLKLLFRILSINEKIIELALSSGFKDFEDAIQYYVAVENKIPYLITRNVSDYSEQGLVILKPKEFIKIFAKKTK